MSVVGVTKSVVGVSNLLTSGTSAQAQIMERTNQQKAKRRRRRRRRRSMGRRRRKRRR